jgi:hypothetical protein
MLVKVLCGLFGVAIWGLLIILILSHLGVKFGIEAFDSLPAKEKPSLIVSVLLVGVVYCLALPWATMSGSLKD